MTGDQFKAARHELDLSVTQMAERLRLAMPHGRTAVREMETGKRPISGPVSVAIELMLKEKKNER